MSDPLGRTIRAIARYPGAILSKTGITPNQVTVLGLFVNCIVAWLIAAGRVNYLSAGILIWAAGFFDALDGSVARLTGRVTAFGDFFDSVLDRYSDSVIYIGILIYFMGTGRTDIVILAVIAIVGSLLVSYVRAKAESLDRECEVGLLPRTARVLILGASFCVNQVFWGLLVIALLSHITVLQRIFHVRKGMAG